MPALGDFSIEKISQTCSVGGLAAKLWLTGPTNLAQPMDKLIKADKDVGQKLLLAVQYEQLDVFKRLLNECQSVTRLPSCKKTNAR